MSFTFKERIISTDAEGYLSNKDDWSEDLMYHMAKLERLTLSQSHLTVIHMVRKYYAEYATTPPIRGLIALLKKEGLTELANSIALAKLFPDGAAKTAAKLAGLPKPVKCI